MRPSPLSYFHRLLSVVCLGLLVGAGLRAAEVVGAVEVADVSATGSTIRWRTDVVTGSRVDYGLAPEQLTLKADAVGVTDTHVVTLADLTPGTKYFFAVGTARRRLATGELVTATGAAPTQAASTAMAKSSPPATGAPPARQTWGNFGSLEDHFRRHGADVTAKTADDYARKAWEFRQRARQGELLVKVDDDGVQRVFDPKSGLFAAYNRDGTTKTFFKPDSRGYFERQPGKPVKAITP